MTRRGILITADGLDRAGTAAALDTLGQWLERRGHRVEVIPSQPSAMVRRAAASRRTRPFLDARVAALLGAADIEHGSMGPVRAGLDRGSVVLFDRYAWTSIARGVARGLDPSWARSLYRFLPRPDLSIYLRQTAADAMRQTLAIVPSDGALAAAAGSYGPFLDRVVSQLDELAAEAAGPHAQPWPVPSLVIDARRSPAATGSTIRDAVRPLLTSSRGGRGSVRGRANGGDATGGEASADLDAGRSLPAPGRGGHGQPGRLIVLEGIDHAGRSTQAGLLERHLRYAGRGVVRTSFGTSLIAGEVLREAKRDRGWDPAAMLLLYAADLAERLQHVIGPALRAGLTVIADRYAYTPAARAVVRGLAPGWVEGLFTFAPRPDAVLLLDLPLSLALARGVADRGIAVSSVDRPVLDSGQAGDYERFQGLVSGWFGDAAERYGFSRINADREAHSVQASIRRSVAPLFDSDARVTATS
ncbi:MAG: hypothetical protein M3067_03450 [Chloroflexota bacterium]|nr:hypothetical protein [Chloroflexota bacterium]